MIEVLQTTPAVVINVSLMLCISFNVSDNASIVTSLIVSHLSKSNHTVCLLGTKEPMRGRNEGNWTLYVGHVLCVCVRQCVVKGSTARESWVP